MRQNTIRILIALFAPFALHGQGDESAYGGTPAVEGEVLVLDEAAFESASAEEFGPVEVAQLDAAGDGGAISEGSVADDYDAVSDTPETPGDDYDPLADESAAAEGDAMVAVDATPATDATGGVVVVDSGDTIVEVPDAEIAGVEAVGATGNQVITEVVDVLPTDTEVVLDLPGGSDDATASMADEERISVDFPDEDIRSVLLNVAELFDLNLVIPDSLQGRTSIKFKNVSWRTVYTEALRPLGYTFEEDRNIVRVVSFEEQNLEPPDTRVFIINYARAGEIQESVAPLVDAAAGGRMQVDTRSNALVITERPSRMNKIQEILERLDRPTHQVMVEAKFVEVLNEDLKNLGVNWASLSGYNLNAGPFAREYNSDFTSERGSTFEDDLLTGTTTTALETLTQSALTGRFDTAVFSADVFNVVLSALQTDRDSKLVSNPTVVVMNNQPALFEVGQDYPIREVTFNQETGTYEAGEVTKEFIGIGLKVTPSVNAAGMINLDVNPKVSSLDGTVESLGAVDPIIGKREAQTTVTIKDGYTLALGGLSETITVDETTGIPVLRNVPGLKWLFKSENDNTQNRNLIVFITSKTLNPDGSDYREVIDPRVLHEMEITPSQIPGYQVPEEEAELYERIATMSDEVVNQKTEMDLQKRAEAIERKDRRKEAEGDNPRVSGS